MIVLSIFLIIPSIIYLIKNGTLIGFKTYYNFFITNEVNKNFSTLVYIALLLAFMIVYVYIIKSKKIKTLKHALLYIGAVSSIFLFMLPWHSSDIFYYMGVGELNSVYGQNPYYVTTKDFCVENQELVKEDSIMKQAYGNFWAGTTVVYGPVAQLIFSFITKISFKNIYVCLLFFKMTNLIVHLVNCFLIYKITKKLKYVLLYGLNPFILIEAIAMVHNDIIVVFLILLTLYFLLRKRRLAPAIFFLAMATGIKYFTILLLPVIILYYYKDEKSIILRIIKCIEYGILFVIILFFEYLMYLRDFNIFLAMMAQTEKYCKSIYSGIYALSKITNNVRFNFFGKEIEYAVLAINLKNFMFYIFAISYILFCFELLFTKNKKFYKIIQKYNIYLVLFIISLSNFQQWYLMWLFGTLFWQKAKYIKEIIFVSFITEMANTVYMFNEESYKYDIWFVIIIFGLYFLYKIIKKLLRSDGLRSLGDRCQTKRTVPKQKGPSPKEEK